jgi:hypothetical protein
MRRRIDQQREEYGRPDLLHCFDNELQTGPGGLRIAQALMDILNHYDRGIDHRTNGDRNAAQRHDVCRQSLVASVRVHCVC